MPTTGASIWARKEPQLLPRSKSGCSRSMMERISFSASLGCKGRSGVSTTAVPSNASFKALAIGQLPVAKNPCRNNIFFIFEHAMSCFQLQRYKIYSEINSYCKNKKNIECHVLRTSRKSSRCSRAQPNTASYTSGGIAVVCSLL